MTSKDMKAAWAWPFTAADAVAITGMDEATRAIVERYRRASLNSLAGNLSFAAQAMSLGPRAIEDEAEFLLERTV